MNNKKESILDRISIAAPCSADWDNMVGDERERFCNQCTLNVYNISSMSKADAEEFLSLRTQGRVCVQFYKRKDGTIITDNCPKGLRVIRDKTRKMIQAASAFLTLIATSNLFAWAQQTNKSSQEMPLRGKVSVKPDANKSDPNKPDPNNAKTNQEIMPLRGEVYVPPKKDDTACFLESEKILKDKLAGLEKTNKDKLAIVRAHLDLASFYRSKNHLDKADSEYSISVKMLSKMPAEKNLYKNSILNRVAVLKLLGNNKEAARLEKSITQDSK
ncbi:MAG: hypothetical protein IPG59_20425 [Candidatus Melainabacteria bacterium]|nr:MAG: hypothetical protein IPG59_20425 [Candidatus Melainabacteria bacterium]